MFNRINHKKENGLIGVNSLIFIFIFFAVSFDTGFWNAPTFSSPNGNISRLAQNLTVTALASRAAGTVEGYQRAFNRWKSFASQTLWVPCFPVSDEFRAIHSVFAGMNKVSFDNKYCFLCY